MEGAPFVVAEKGKVCVRVRRGRRGSEFGVADRQGLPTETTLTRPARFHELRNDRFTSLCL